MLFKAWPQWFILPLILALSSVAYAVTPKWEYLVKTYPLVGDDKWLTKELNKPGKENWELVNCPESNAKITCIFKRSIKKG